METPRVLLVQRILPPYRLPFFQRLTASPHLSLSIAYDKASAGSALANINMPLGLDAIQVRNHYGGRRESAVWQQGVLSLVTSKLYDVIIAEFNPRILSSVLACLYARYFSVRWIWWGHGLSPRSNSVSVRLRVWLSGIADATIFYDATQRDTFVSLGTPEKRTFVAYNAIDTEEINRFVQPRTRSERYRILYIGRLLLRKKVDLLIKGFARAVASLPGETTLTIIGDGPERENLCHLVQQLELSGRVEFVGALYQQAQLAPLFNSAWVSVSPGCIGLSAIHSLAYGVPILIARDEPHGPERAALEEGGNCIFFPSNSAGAIGEQLVMLAHASEQWAAMALIARQKILSRFNLSAMVQTFEQTVQYVQRPSPENQRQPLPVRTR